MYVQFLPNKLTYKLHISENLYAAKDGQELKPKYVRAIINKNIIQ